MRAYIFATLIVISLCLPGQASAQSRDVPYWATIKTDELNMRVGPSRQYRIAWVFKRRGLPVKIIRVVDAWRLIEDIDGTRGWVSANLLSPQTGGMVTGAGTAPMRAQPQSGARLKWNLAVGVVGVLGECSDGWCAFEVRGHKGWVPQDRLWGAATL
ncbi:MAG: SH3 domain-containing protein [Pontixanthobacter sp.]